MLVFLDFEASSLSDRSYPIEVGWVWEDGRGEAHLIHPAPRWTDWDMRAQAIHGIARAELETKGEDHAAVARRMVDVLSGHDLCASAPSWDGKWLSALLRAADLPRHSLRLRDSDDVIAESARAILHPHLPADRLQSALETILTLDDLREGAPTHRALEDAQGEWRKWQRVTERAREIAGEHVRA
ncbi:transcriptional regulator [Croceibacterium sp. TMG7-5b_MA50]|uniref:3'-5' exonuclease n=1 Tax=Croceibacterium sp. TMG7-5b_MA50 TaxID=3121290 RepID=UPI003221B6EE